MASRPGLPWTVFLLSCPFRAYLLSACWRSHWPLLRGPLGAEWCHSQGVLWAPAARACASLLAPRGRTVCPPGPPAFPLRSCLTREREVVVLQGARSSEPRVGTILSWRPREEPCSPAWPPGPRLGSEVGGSGYSLTGWLGKGCPLGGGSPGIPKELGLCSPWDGILSWPREQGQYFCGCCYGFPQLHTGNSTYVSCRVSRPQV